mmetsp:Transcript_18574/g.59134  ORF Transcript_18574/g.59134 Transcript_18574/m.59134 type:complete len:241 (-) Transcript_18574:242-964(-)
MARRDASCLIAADEACSHLAPRRHNALQCHIHHGHHAMLCCLLGRGTSGRRGWAKKRGRREDAAPGHMIVVLHDLDWRHCCILDDHVLVRDVRHQAGGRAVAMCSGPRLDPHTKCRAHHEDPPERHVPHATCSWTDGVDAANGGALPPLKHTVLDHHVLRAWTTAGARLDRDAVIAVGDVDALDQDVLTAQPRIDAVRVGRRKRVPLVVGPCGQLRRVRHDGRVSHGEACRVQREHVEHW